MNFLKDTVLAIQALSSVAYLLTGREQDLSISFTHSAVADYEEMLNISASNANIFYTYEVCYEFILFFYVKSVVAFILCLFLRPPCFIGYI